MKKILSTLALSSLVLLTTGCSDFLEEENHSNVMQDFMATPSGFSMALNSVYANVRSTYSAEEGIHGLMNPGTDELKNNIGGSNRCALTFSLKTSIPFVCLSEGCTSSTTLPSQSVLSARIKPPGRTIGNTKS